MLNGIKKQAGVLWQDWLVGVPVILGGFAVGMILCPLIMNLEGDVRHSIPLGTVIAAVVAAMYLFIMTCSEMIVYFPLQVSMGYTRKEFFLSYYPISLTGVFGAFLLLLSLGATEQKLLPILYSGREPKLRVLPYVMRLGIPVGVFLVLAAGLATAMVMRFGKPVFWFFWSLWMVACLGLPLLFDWIEENPQTAAARLTRSLAEFITSISMGMWIALGILAAAAVLGSSFWILRRQEIKL